ncbi:hypothetical protein GCM10020331_029890 [Ectobacillus funiculus]
MSYTEALSYYLGAFVDELTRLGVCETVISPGSRSTPLAMLMAEHESMKTYVHVDERSAAYFCAWHCQGKEEACSYSLYIWYSGSQLLAGCK